MVKPLKWYYECSMVRNGKGISSVFLGDSARLSGGMEITRTGNDSPNGVSLRSGSISSLHQAIKRLEATIKEMQDTAAHIEKFGLDSSE